MSEEYYLDELETETEIQKKDIVILHQEIERLTKVEQEHQRINGELREENKRLNNIINELEKWLFDNKNCVPKHITDYFEKLKGENNE